MNETPYKALLVDAPSPQVGVIMWIPGGLNTINAIYAGKPKTVTVFVAKEDAAIAQQTLELLKARSPQRPFFDFDHENNEASGWPLEFFWSETPAPGIYARLEYSAAGEQAIQGKTYRAFSPTFYANEAKPARLFVPKNPELNMGGFVNDPAFTKILPLWAKRAITPAIADKPNKDPMKAQELAALKAKRTTAENELAGLKAAEASSEKITAKQAEINQITTDIIIGEKDVENQELKAKLNLQAEAKAEAAITAAVNRGAIPAKDEALKAKWKSMLVADDSTHEILQSLPGNSAISAGRVVQPGSGIVIAKEDITHVVKGYQAANTPEERGAFWASNMRSRLDTEWQRMIQAANSVGSLSGDLIVQRSLDLLKYQFPMLSMISTDFSSENAAKGQVIKTRLRTVPAVSEYDETNGYAVNDATTTDVPLTISKHISTQISFNANELASTQRALFPEQEEGMHYAIGNDLMGDIVSLFTAGNFNEDPTVVALNDFNRRGVIAMKTALNKRKIFGGRRFLMLNSDYHSKLEEDTSIVSALINSGANGAIATGKLPPVAGFDPFEADYLPTAGNLVGFGGRSDAVAIATRLPNDYANVFPGLPQTGVLRVVTNPDLNISVMLAQFVDHLLGRSYCRIALMTGKAKGNPKSGQRLTSAAVAA